MTRYGHIGWRMAAVAAFVGTAALAVVLTRVPIESHIISNPTCPPSGLQAWLGLGTTPATETTSSTYYTLEFTNISDHACSIYGYPEVAAYMVSQMTGRPAMSAQIGSAAIRDTSIRPQPVMLAPGATAHAVLRVADTGSLQRAACDAVTAQALRVALPDQQRPAFVALRIPACSKPGQAFLSVQAIQARPGVPGRAMP
jgi:hypothetical protein